ncbi:histidine kinase [Duganella rhizosphaerae]|uniref:sensor histidine kinase n=1 Tax=Duganella rhizosphaerae TaxID=2885763 RepID=UPI0030E93BFB
MIKNALPTLRARLAAYRQDSSRWWIDYNNDNDILVKRVVALSWIGLVGMPLFYFLWRSWIPQPYESPMLRGIGFALCVPGIMARRYADRRWLSAYLFVGLTYMLPFFFTYMYLMNGGNNIWSQSLLVAVIVLFHFDTVSAFLVYLVGTGLAYLAYSEHWWIGAGGPAHARFNVDELTQWPIHVFAIGCVSLVKVGRDVLARERLAGMASALATVSHELRTPLLSIDANSRGMRRILYEARLPDAGHEAFDGALTRVSSEVRMMNTTIDLLLLGVTSGNKNLQGNQELSMLAMVLSAQERYFFTNSSGQDMISLTLRADFQFQGQPELCSMILINLMRNAAAAVQRAGKGRIRIIIDGARARPRVLFIDTGCGIAPQNLRNIFQRFYSSPAGNGAGIGLAFCKDVLDAWGAQIRCVSRLHYYTVFVLEFAPSQPNPQC